MVNFRKGEMRMKRYLTIALALTILTAVFAGGGAGFASERPESWLCDEKTTLTVFTYDADSNTMPAPSNDLPFWAWLEDYTNVHIEWEIVPNASFNQVLSARLAAGEDLADIVRISTSSVLTSAGDGGTILDLAPYWEACTPNLQSYFAGGEMDYKGLITDPNGHMYGLYGTINPTENRITALYNAQWLEKLGAEVPKTLDEFEALLRKIKEAGDLNGNGQADEIPLSSASIGYMISYLGFAHGLHQYEGGNYFQVDENGKVYDERVSEPMKRTLKYMNSLYEEGLLDPEICNMSFDIMSQKAAANRVGAIALYSSFAPAYGAMMPQGRDDPLGEHLTVGPSLKSEYNGQTAPMFRNENLGGCAAISAQCQNPELAVRWLDTLIADENALTTRCWGFEGEDWQYGPDGQKQLVQPADGGKWNINPKGCGQISLPHLQTDEQLQNPDSNLPWYIDQCNALKEESAWFGPAIPNVLLSAEEEELMSLSQTDVQTYYEEMRDKFIKGEDSIDEKWDTYVENMWKLGLQNLIDATQSVYDRTR